MTPAIVSMRNVAVRKPGALILRSVDLDLGPGSATALFGANGSGKTTLLRVAATLLRPTSGEGTVLGASLGTAAVEAIRPQIGLVGHEPALYPNLTLLENLQLAASLIGVDEAGAAAALQTVGLGAAANRRVTRSSNGMRRRVEFARLLMIRPRLLLLDEAHVGLDPSAWELVTHLVGSVTTAGGAALIVAHEESLVLPMVGAALRLIDGTIEVTG